MTGAGVPYAGIRQRRRADRPGRASGSRSALIAAPPPDGSPEAGAPGPASRPRRAARSGSGRAPGRRGERRRRRAAASRAGGRGCVGRGGRARGLRRIGCAAKASAVSATPASARESADRSHHCAPRRAPAAGRRSRPGSCPASASGRVVMTVVPGWICGAADLGQRVGLQADLDRHDLGLHQRHRRPAGAPARPLRRAAPAPRAPAAAGDAPAPPPCARAPAAGAPPRSGRRRGQRGDRVDVRAVLGLEHRGARHDDRVGMELLAHVDAHQHPAAQPIVRVRNAHARAIRERPRVGVALTSITDAL